MRYLLFALLLLAGRSARTQSLPLRIIAAAGTEVSGPGYTLCYTVGEVAVRTASNPIIKLQEGFWQPGINCATSSVIELDGVALDVQVYPNPSSTYFTLDFNAALPQALHGGLYDLLGRRVQEIVVAPGETEVRLGDPEMAPGLYFLRLQSPYGRTVKTFKVQKTN